MPLALELPLLVAPIALFHASHAEELVAAVLGRARFVHADAMALLAVRGVDAVVAPDAASVPEAADRMSRALRLAFGHLVHETDLASALHDVRRHADALATTLTGLLVGAAHGAAGRAQRPADGALASARVADCPRRARALERRIATRIAHRAPLAVPRRVCLRQGPLRGRATLGWHIAALVPVLVARHRARHGAWTGRTSRICRSGSRRSSRSGSPVGALHVALGDHARDGPKDLALLEASRPHARPMRVVQTGRPEARGA